MFILTGGSIHEFREELAEDAICLAEDREAESDTYPYQRHWQPALAYGALGTCLFILLVCNGVFLWKKFHVSPFLRGYLTVRALKLITRLQRANRPQQTICFFGVWVLLKLYKKSWSPWNTLDVKSMKDLIKELNDIRYRSLEQPEDDSETTRWKWIWKVIGKDRPGHTVAR